MSFLVTGATGFLGRRVVRELAADGCQVRVFLRPASRVDELREFVGRDLWPQVDVFRGDLMSRDSCRAALEGIDVVEHVAAGLSGGAAVLFLNSVIPTRRLLEACVESGVRRFVHVSSLGVYGAAGLKHGATLDESCPVESRPELRDPYTYSKVVQERVVWEAHREHGLPVVVLRPGVIYGPGRGALSHRIGLTVGGVVFRIGRRRRLPYIYVDHCATALRQAGMTPGIEGEAFNLLDDELPTAASALRMVRRAGGSVKAIGIPQWAIGSLSSIYERYSNWSEGQLPGVITRYKSDALWKPLNYSNAKARDRLRWRPHLSLEETFRRSLNS